VANQPNHGLMRGKTFSSYLINLPAVGPSRSVTGKRITYSNPTKSNPKWIPTQPPSALSTPLVEPPLSVFAPCPCPFAVYCPVHFAPPQPGPGAPRCPAVRPSATQISGRSGVAGAVAVAAAAAAAEDEVETHGGGRASIA
jgi:hypothetical protein